MNSVKKRTLVIILGIVAIIGIITLSFVLLFSHKTQDDITGSILKENVSIKSIYYDSISPTASSENYTKIDFNFSKGEVIEDIVLSEAQTFYKYVQLTGPKENEMLDKHNVTHYSYSFLLTGDLIEESVNGEKSIKISNARISYNRIPISLLSDENLVYITNTKKTKNKLVTFTEFKNALNSTTQRNTMISW